MAVPVWHGGLTQKQSKEIERVQKVVFRIILINNYRNYDNALKTLHTEILYQRRINICKSFASKNLKSEFSFFEKVKKYPNTRSKTKLVREFKCNTARYSKSSLPYLANLVNSMWSLTLFLHTPYMLPVDNGGSDKLSVLTLSGHKFVIHCPLPLANSSQINK